MILTSLPDLPPRPQTDANAPFRRAFYARWGHENALVCGRARHAEFAPLAQTLSIKSAADGAERYLLRGRDVLVDDDNFLVLNEGSTYGSVLAARRPVWSFAVFFRPGLHEEVLAARGQALQAALEEPHAPRRPCGFSEHLRPHHAALSQRLRVMRDGAIDGERSEDWLEEHLLALAETLLTIEAGDAAATRDRLNTARVATRRELLRRLRLAADYIETCHAQPLTLDAMARVACLSRFHFVRLFRQCFGVTPYACLVRKRARVAARLLAAGEADREQVALQVGFGTRWALHRALQRHGLAGRASAGCAWP